MAVGDLLSIQGVWPTFPTGVGVVAPAAEPPQKGRRPERIPITIAPSPPIPVPVDLPFAGSTSAVAITYAAAVYVERVFAGAAVATLAAHGRAQADRAAFGQAAVRAETAAAVRVQDDLAELLLLAGVL